MKKNKNRFAFTIIALLVAFYQFNDKLLALDENIALAVVIGFVSLGFAIAYAKYKDDQKSNSVDYRRLAIAGVFVLYTIGYGIYSYTAL